MNAKISVFVICVEVIIYLLSYNLHDCIFNDLLALRNRLHPSTVNEHISCHLSLSITSENIRKSQVSRVFDVFRVYRMRPVT